MTTLCRLSLVPLAFALGLLSGCGLSGPPADVRPADTPLAGRVHGGQQPVSGSAISLYAAGASGNGLGSTQLLKKAVYTDAAGGFSLTGAFACPSASTQVYLVARGGNPGLGTNASNPALVLMAPLGDCGALTASTFIYVNEVTTAAAAWALAQFLAPNAAVGASPTNATGLRNAFLAAGNLVNASTGNAPGALPVGAGFEVAKLNSLANALAPCVNSDGSTACAPLFAASGVQTNTLDAALGIVQHPGINTAAVFNVAGPQPLFQPALPAPPHDWTLSLTYGQCSPASLCGGLSDPGTLALDSTGSVWVANYSSPVVSKFSPAGIPAAPAGFPGLGLRQSYGLTVAPDDSAWVTNQQSVAAALNHQNGSVSHFTSSGVETSGPGITAGGIYYPQAIAADPAGNLWVANYGNSSASLLSSSGSALSSGGYAASQLPFVTSVAIDGSRNAWFGAQKLIGQVTPLGSTTAYPCCNYPAGIAIAGTGNLWLADYPASTVVQVSPTGATLSTTSLGAGTNAASALAIDGAGTVWTANYYGNSISRLAPGTGALSSPQGGFGQDAPLDEPYSIAVDSSGNLWLSNAYASTLTEFLGLAAPVRTPLLGPPVAP